MPNSQSGNKSASKPENEQPEASNQPGSPAWFANPKVPVIEKLKRLPKGSKLRSVVAMPSPPTSKAKFPAPKK